MPPAGQTDWLSEALCSLTVHLIRLSIRPLVCYQTREHHMLKTNEPILMEIGTQGKGTKW